MTQPATEKRVSDRPFNPSRLPITSESRGLVLEVLDRLSSAERRCKRRQAMARLTHERAVSALTCDLVHLHLTKPTEWMTVELSKSVLSPARRRAPFMTETNPSSHWTSLSRHFAWPTLKLAPSYPRVTSTPSGDWSSTAAKPSRSSTRCCVRIPCIPVSRKTLVGRCPRAGSSSAPTASLLATTRRLSLCSVRPAACASCTMKARSSYVSCCA